MSMRASNCPCCGSSFLLRHVRNGEIYWFCQSCRQEVSLLTVNRTSTSGVEVKSKSLVNSQIT
jgi:ribosomal protein L37AE/L43A